MVISHIRSHLFLHLRDQINEDDTQWLNKLKVISEVQSLGAITTSVSIRLRVEIKAARKLVFFHDCFTGFRLFFLNFAGNFRVNKRLNAFK